MQYWKLEDVEKKAKEFPESFFIPSAFERKSKKKGESVRLHFILLDKKADYPEAERMWVTITHEKTLFSKYKGILENQPAYIKELNVGDEIEFDANNIAQTIIKKSDPLWIDCSEKRALVSNMCLQKGEVIRFIYRENADNDEDSGWRMFTGHEDDEYTNNPQNVRVIQVGYLLDLDKTLIDPLKNGSFSAFERMDKTEKWKIIEDWKPSE